MEINLKIIFLGESRAGKTCLMKRIIYNSFDEKEESTKPTNLSYNTKEYKSKTGADYFFGIWDTAGEEEFDSISTFYYRGAGCALIVYDITNRKSFEGISRFTEKLVLSSPDVFSILIGTKLDLVEDNITARVVTTEEGRRKANELHAKFLETSSKTGQNIAQLWEEVGEAYHSKFGKKPKEINEVDDPNRIKNLKTHPSSNKKTKCC
ncbi:ras-related protein rab-5b-related [Anaeramoeba ignava]|uniref:Ras-related protein rab-5b-related n=1 Tax=Anaeramoeba ignava TaxID=1746090 RepID=A0A9Q0LJ54_ANAIG|nr:ras-related protein rab-5b-related [Anaeramoeba ignava]